MTFSITACCERTGRFGAAIASSSPVVGARCITTRAGVGAVANQHRADPRLSDRLLELLSMGKTADEAMAQVVNENALIQFRQLAVVDIAGGSTAFTGERVQEIHQFARIPYAAAIGNRLHDPAIPDRMLAVFAEDPGAELEDRLFRALYAAKALGGESGPIHSAAIQIAGSVSWPETDLRVDWAKDPIHELEKLWRLWRPLVDNFLIRALDPSAVRLA